RLRRGFMSSSKKDQKREESQNFELRITGVQWLVVVILFALGIRFYVLQVTRHDDYVARAENNRVREIPLLAPRGAIYDRNDVLLVDNTPASNVVIYPEN